MGEVANGRKGRRWNGQECSVDAVKKKRKRKRKEGRT